MIHHAVVQGSEAWLRLRLGMPTASEFSRIITPAKWELAKEGRRSYQIQLLTELLLDGPLDSPTTPAMIHGNDFEAKAVAAYELQEGIDTTPCGFCINDEGCIGASPDTFVGEDGSLEVKSPFRPEIHVAYLLNPGTLEAVKESTRPTPGSFLAEYWVQVQGQLYVTGRKWTDLISYFMGLPMVRVRITPHEEFQAKLGWCLRTFLTELDSLKAVAIERGCKFPPREAVPAAKDHGKDFVTDADVDMLIRTGAIRPGGQ